MELHDQTAAEIAQINFSRFLNGQVVVVQLIAPVRVVVVLENQSLAPIMAMRVTLPQSLRTARRSADWVVVLRRAV